jgi:putative transposase
MWTKEHQGRQATFERRPYPTDLTDAEWEAVRPLSPRPAERGRPPSSDMRGVPNAIRSLARAGCGWRTLPAHFGPWQSVYWRFRRLARCLLFQTIHDIALLPDRERAGREASPTAGVLDSRTVKALRRVGAATTRARGRMGASGTPRRTSTGGRSWSTWPLPTRRTRPVEKRASFCSS